MRLIGLIAFLSPAAALASTPISWDQMGTYVLVGGLTSSTSTLDDELDQARSIGIRHVRMSMAQWERMETSSGTFDWSALRSFVDLATGYGMKFLFTIPHSGTWTPRDSCPGTFSPTGASVPCDRFPTTNAGLYRRFARELAQEFCDDGAMIEVLNEPDYGVFWKAATLPRTTDYIETALKPAYEGAKLGCPGMTVIMGGMAFPQGIDSAIQSTGTYTGQAWFAEGLANGLADYTDMWNVHIYKTAGTTYGEDTDFAAVVATITAQVELAGVDPKPILVSETSTFGGSYSGDSAADEAEKATWMFTRYARAMGSLGPDGPEDNYIARTFWHTLRAYTGGGDFSLMTSTFGARPSYIAYSTWWAAMNGAKWWKKGDSGGVSMEMFKQPDGRNISVIWRESGTSTLSLDYYPSSATVIETDGTETIKTGGELRTLSITTDPIILKYEVNEACPCS